MLSDCGGLVQQLMHFSTKPTSSASAAVQGSFSKHGAVEYVLMTHDSIELYRLSANAENKLVHRQIFHGTLLGVAAVACDQAGGCDALALTSESGFLTLLRYSTDNECHSGWKVIGSELIGKSGVRSSVPGEYLCADPSGKCIFVAAPYKEKMFFRVHDLGTDITLQSPLESRRFTCVFSSVPVIYQGSTPIFATLESPLPSPTVSQSDLGQKFVCFYTYDLNLNQIRTVQLAVPSDSTFLAPCYNVTPGVLVCTPFSVLWLSMDTALGYTEISMPLRQDNKSENYGSLITGSAFYKSSPIFFLIQNEFGDLFRVRVGEKSYPIDYFGRISPGSSLLILKGGFLVSASETGDHHLLKITREGFPSSQLLGSVNLSRNGALVQVPTYSSSDNSNMVQQHIIVNTSPCFAMKMAQPVRGRMRYFSLTHSNQLHCTSYGLSTVASAALGIGMSGADAMFLLHDPTPVSREGQPIEWHSRLLITHRQETAVFSLVATKDHMLPVVPESQLVFDNHSRTVFAALLDGGCYLQVTPTAVHAIRGLQRSSWFVGELGNPTLLIRAAAANRRQIVLSFTDRGVVTINFDSQTGILHVVKVGLHLPRVNALAIPPIFGGSLASFVGIALEDQGKERFAIFAFDSLRPCSKYVDTVVRYTSVHATYMTDNRLHVFLGTSAGQLIRAGLTADGDISLVEQFQLGQSPCRVFTGDNRSHCYAQSDEVWRCFFEEGSHKRIPVSLNFAPRLVEAFDASSGREGLLAMFDDKLIPLTISVGGGSLYTTQSLQLCGTGRKMERLFVGSPAKEVMVIACRDGAGGAARSALQVQDTALHFTSQEMPLAQGESVVSMAVGTIQALGSSPVVLVGVAKNFSQTPKIVHGECRVSLFTLNDMHLIPQQSYVTPVPDLPSAIHITPTGHVVVGMGPEHGLLMLECGRSRFLQKHRLLDIGSRIVAIDSSATKSPYAVGDLENCSSFVLACGTADSSVCLVRYHNTKDYQFLIRVATDDIPRNIIALRFISQNSFVCSDRFGNVSFMAIPDDAITDIPDRSLLDDTEEHRQSQTLRLTGQFHVGQLVNSLDVVSVPKRDGSAEQVVIYSTILGAAGCFVPFQTEEDAVFAVLADSHIKESIPSLLQRTPYAHQSSFYPPCGVIDGNLWQQFTSSKPNEDVNKKIVDDAKASDKRMVLLVSNTEVPRFADLTADTLISYVKSVVGRTKPSSIY